MTAPACEGCEAEPVKPCAYCPVDGDDTCPECLAALVAPGAVICSSCASRDLSPSVAQGLSRGETVACLTPPEAAVSSSTERAGMVPAVTGAARVDPGRTPGRAAPASPLSIR